MQYGRAVCYLAALALSVPLLAFGHTTIQNSGDVSAKLRMRKVPENVILVKGAWSSASDSNTPVPEGGSIINNVFCNRYFGLTYSLPPDWVQRYSGPPPSDSGRYVLAELSRPNNYKGDARGNILITAQDMFFTPLPEANTSELINYTEKHLPGDYRLELARMDTETAGRAFARLAYWSPVAKLYWYVLATEIRCHTVEFVFMNRDPKTLENIVLQASKMKLPKEASLTGDTDESGVPVCIKDYASSGNVIERINPVFSEPRFNPVPVRIIIGKQGRVKYIHFLSAFPDQAKAISDALSQWKFRPYLRDGQRVEVETGIMFGRGNQRPLVKLSSRPAFVQ